jgi:hypothetical protein
MHVFAKSTFGMLVSGGISASISRKYPTGTLSPIGLARDTLPMILQGNGPT